MRLAQQIVDPIAEIFRERNWLATLRRTSRKKGNFDMGTLKDFTLKSLAAFCLLGAISLGTAQAATDSPANPGPTSTGHVDVTVTVPDLVWIQRLGAIALTYVPGSDATGEDEFCVYSSTGAYDLTISSLTATGTTTFTATGQAVPANTVDFGVKFDTDLDASDGADVTEAATISNLVNPVTGLPPTCAADNSSIEVTFLESANLDSAPADVYEDELTLLVEPF
jgi:hypothetical protein